MSWSLVCGFCQRTFTATAARAYCSKLCRDKHKWYGVTPDAHRTYAARVARP